MARPVTSRPPNSESIDPCVQARGRGFGEAVTAAATYSLFDDGAVAVVLQASVMGEPVYARMGFRTFTTYTQWAIDAPAATDAARG